MDIGLKEMGGKRPVKGVNKVCWRDKQTRQKQIRNGKILCKKNTKSAFLENSKAYPSWQKLHDDDQFFFVSSDNLLDF